MIKYTLDIKLPSLNEVINANRTHQMAGAKLKKTIEDELCWLIKSQGLKRITRPCIVHIKWQEKDKRRDVDNIISSQKFILDSLVKMGVLPDDNQKWVKQIVPIVETSKDKKYKVIIELEEEENV